MKSTTFAIRSFVFACALTAAISMSTASAEQASTASEEQIFIDLMDGYLDLSRDVVELASSREATVFLAIEGIVEIYEGRGEKGHSIEHLNRIIESYPDNLAVRNLVRMKLKDIYVELDQSDEALKILDTIIDENKG